MTKSVFILKKKAEKCSFLRFMVIFVQAKPIKNRFAFIFYGKAAAVTLFILRKKPG